MSRWLWLAAAVVSEVTATLSLRAAVDTPAWIALVVAGYLGSFVLLGYTLRAGIPVAVAYGIWGAAGVALTAAFGVLLFHEQLGPTAWAGIVLVIAGVVLVQTGAPRAPGAETGVPLDTGPARRPAPGEGR
ncbi:DMT family transporter [Gordonia sp. VNK21]|uniref:DMT family transporter n=1 Tax=Gordonia sp. VNK21 TaxID=3382483 RepID=UPI0038D4BDC0